MDIYPPGETLSEEGGDENGVFNGRLDCNDGENIEGYPLGELLGAYGDVEIRSYNGM